MSRVITIITAHFKSWYRSRSNIFWTIAFPLLLIVLFGAIFGNGSTKFDLYVQNRDLAAATPTMLSANYVSTLNGTGAFTLHMVPAEQQQALDFVQNDARIHNRGQRLLVVPVGFADNLTRTKSASIQLYMDQSDQASASLAGIVTAATTSYAAHLYGASTPNTVSVQQQSIITRNVRYIDFFIPGVIGMVLANFVKEAEGADAAANAITFPMMFLSGTFWPRETLPDILKVIANFMPLTYINDGLRDSMIYLLPGQAVTNTIIALGLAVFFIVLGSLLMNWKEE